MFLFWQVFIGWLFFFELLIHKLPRRFFSSSRFFFLLFFYCGSLWKRSSLGSREMPLVLLEIFLNCNSFKLSFCSYRLRGNFTGSYLSTSFLFPGNRFWFLELLFLLRLNFLLNRPRSYLCRFLLNYPRNFSNEFLCLFFRFSFQFSFFFQFLSALKVNTIGVS